MIQYLQVSRSRAQCGPVPYAGAQGGVMSIFIVDKSVIVRERLAEVLSGLPTVQVVGQAQGADEAVEAIQRVKPDVVILDPHLLEGGGIQVLQEIKKGAPGPIVMVLTNFVDLQYRKRCLEAGAEFFFDKSLEFDMVRNVLQQLH